MTALTLWQAAVLGIVQGLTEFLPISSTAHLLLVQEWWFGRSREELQDDPFTVVIQLGTLFAVLVYFRHDIVRILNAFFADLFRGKLLSSSSPESRLAKYIIIGSIPAGVAGLLLKKVLKEHFYNAVSIAVVAIVFALIMLLAEWWGKRTAQRGEESVTLKDSLIVGVFQAFALMPGGSRSGCTISGGLVAGLARSAAARFSFLLSLPIMFAAGIKELYDWFKVIRKNPEMQAHANDQIAALAVGTAVSAVVGFLAIHWLLKFLSKNTMLVFVIYRVLLGAGILVAVAMM